MNNFEPTGWKHNYPWIPVLLLIFVGYATVSCSRRSEELIRADSAVVFSEFGLLGDFITTTICCERGEVRASVSSNLVLCSDRKARLFLKQDVKVSMEAYLGLWAELQRNDVWELPAGEMWSWVEWLEAGRAIPASIRARPEEYDDLPLDCGISTVKLRVGDRNHGFIRWCHWKLKDARYKRIAAAIQDLQGMREARIKVMGP